MLSNALLQVLERARVRFGLDIEILDADLRSVYPDGGADLSRIVKGSEAVRRTLLDAMIAGRPQEVEGLSGRYRLFTLRPSGKRRQSAALLAVKRNGECAFSSQGTESWMELAGAMVEADLAAVHTVGEERQRARGLEGVFRFLEFLAGTTDESQLADALIQAAAVWYDVDARVYRRNLKDEFVLHTWLPGVNPEETSRRLSSALIGSDAHFRRLASSSDLGELGAAHEAAVVPLSSGVRTDWIMTFIGTIPPGADEALQALGRVSGTFLAALAARRAETASARVQHLISQSASAPELVAMWVVRELVERSGAAAGSLSLITDGRARRLAAFGTPSPATSASLSDSVFAADHFVYGMALRGSDRAVLELWAAQGTEFTPEAAALTQACAGLLSAWIAGTLASLAPTAPWDGTRWSVPDFAARIQEELDRARRFDLRLALILLDVVAPEDVVAALQEALRRELRGSDVTGAVSGRQVAALLTHTDETGLDNVARRLKTRLADAAERLNVSELKLGQAAFSADCRTVDALVSHAVIHAEPVILH